MDFILNFVPVLPNTQVKYDRRKRSKLTALIVMLNFDISLPSRFHLFTHRGIKAFIYVWNICSIWRGTQQRVLSEYFDKPLLVSGPKISIIYNTSFLISSCNPTSSPTAQLFTFYASFPFTTGKKIPRLWITQRWEMFTSLLLKSLSPLCVRQTLGNCFKLDVLYNDHSFV